MNMYEILWIIDICISYDLRGFGVRTERLMRFPPPLIATIEAYIADAEMGPALCTGTLSLDGPEAFKLLYVKPNKIDAQAGVFRLRKTEDKRSLAEKVDNWIISTDS